PHLSHPIHAKTQRAPKTRTMHKSINPPLHFYRFTFLRFYTFTENSQRKIHHPTPLDKHWSVNNPASYLGKDYGSLHIIITTPQKTRFIRQDK
ncbi:hypothetical protein, partial [Bartonella sp. CE47NXGY]|uniref:hypothetical protein n=1 Tax=Bartonella sp. CE47NXGY TaxID=3243514 RepID=UPI0035CF0781